jgi:hypothetical protein
MSVLYHTRAGAGSQNDCDAGNRRWKPRSVSSVGFQRRFPASDRFFLRLETDLGKYSEAGTDLGKNSEVGTDPGKFCRRWKRRRQKFRCRKIRRRWKPILEMNSNIGTDTDKLIPIPVPILQKNNDINCFF